MDKQFTVDDILNAKKVYFYDYDDTLYIVDNDDEAYGYKKDSPGWFHKRNFWDYFDSSLMLCYFHCLTKEEAVRIYLAWTKYNPKADLSDATYSVYSSRRRYINFHISNKKLTLACQDFGPECRVMTGDDEYEFFYELTKDNTRRFMEKLRAEYGSEADLSGLLKKAFGSDDGTTLFTEFCDRNNIKYRFISI